MTPPRTGRAFLDAVLDQPGSVLAFAHRGGARHPDVAELENTLVAFEHACALGYRYLETDVHVSLDGVLLAFHDDVLDRVTDATGTLAQLREAEIRGARIGGRESVPTLADVFDALPADTHFNIDLKSMGSVPALADFIAARGVQDRVLVGSFSRRRMHEFRRITSAQVATSATPSEVAAFVGAPSLAATRRVSRAFDALQIPHRHRRLRVTTARLVRRAHAADKHVHVWTVDEAEEMRELLALGVDGLMTDRTDVLKTVLLEDGRWRESTR
ncbi:MAG: glycerophosphodiester phosphodiesterase [Nocardioides sp.]